MNAKERLEELLVKNYEFIKDNHGQPNPSLSSHIQGFMEACLIERSLSRTTVEQIINNAHRSVFGLDFKKRDELEKATEDWLDIPTHIRHKKKIDV